MKKLLILFLLNSLFLISFSCVNDNDNNKSSIIVTIEPQRFFVEKIVGDKFDVKAIVPKGQSPETFDPSTKQIMELSKSKAYFRIGYIGFELAWLKNIEENNPKLPIYDLSKDMNLIENSYLDSEDLNHVNHDHGVVDPHIWNSVDGAKIIAKNTLNALIELDSSNRIYYEKNYNDLLKIIKQVEDETDKMLKPLLNRSFIIYHPALSYYAREYGLNQLCIENEGKEPSPTQMKELIDMAKKHNIRVVFVQKEFDSKNVEIIANEIDCKKVVINPLAYDWSGEMIHIAKSLSEN